MNYSQNDEQQVIQKYFGLRVGNFLDIGSNDGETLSNVRALALSGWTGVCFEPDPEPFKRLEDLYKGSQVLCYNMAIADKSGTLPFWASGSHLKKGDVGLLGTLKEMEIERWKGTEEFEPIEVECITWKEFYKGCDCGPFQFVSIDAEGMDLEILHQMDLKEMGVELLCIEWNNVPSVKSEISKICKAAGMRLIYVNYENLIYGI